MLLLPGVYLIVRQPNGRVTWRQSVPVLGDMEECRFPEITVNQNEMSSEQSFVIEAWAESEQLGVSTLIGSGTIEVACIVVGEWYAALCVFVFVDLSEITCFRCTVPSSAKSFGFNVSSYRLTVRLRVAASGLSS